MKSLQSANVRHRVSEPLNFKHSYTLEVFDKRDFIFFSQVFFLQELKKKNLTTFEIVLGGVVGHKWEDRKEDNQT